MTGGEPPPPHGPSGPLVRFLFLTLLAVAWLLPPETRGESAAGCAVLVFLLPLVLLADAARVAPYVAAAAAGAALLAFPAIAPAASVVPVAVALAALVVGALASRQRLRLGEGEALPWTIAAVGVLLSAYALHQYFGGLAATARELEGLGIPAEDALIARLLAGRPFAAFATPAALGGAFAIVIPVTFGLALESIGRRRILASASAILATVALAATASGTAVAALACGTALVLGRRATARRTIVSVSIAMVVLCLAVVAARGTRVIDPTHAESPWRLRAGNVRVAAEMAAEHPFVGVGPGNYGETFPAYRRPGDNESRHAHNLPAELIAETGLLAGTILSLLFFGCFLKPAWIAALAPSGWKAGAAAGLAAFALQNLADFTVFFPSLLWGAVILRGAVSPPGPALDARPPRRILAAATLTVAALACAAVARSGLGWNELIACREFAAGGARTESLHLARRAVAMAPWDIDARLQQVELELGALVAAGGATPAVWDELLGSADAAVLLSPSRPSARAVRARVRLGARDLPGAFADLAEAARLYPMNPEYARQRDELATRLPSGDRAARSGTAP